MKFYRSPTDYVEIVETNDKKLKNILATKYGYIDDFTGFTDETLINWAKNFNFLVYTNDFVFREDVLSRNDRTCRNLADFVKSNTPEEQWRYYRYFLECEPSTRYVFNGIRDEYVAIFDEAGVVILRHDGDMLIIEKKDGDIINMVEMKRLEWEKLIRDLKTHGQLKE